MISGAHFSNRCCTLAQRNCLTSLLPYFYSITMSAFLLLFSSIAIQLIQTCAFLCKVAWLKTPLCFRWASILIECPLKIDLRTVQGLPSPHWSHPGWWTPLGWCLTSVLRSKWKFKWKRNIYHPASDWVGGQGWWMHRQGDTSVQ